VSDLFTSAQASSPPPYGSLTPSEERQLHDADRRAWLAYVAPGFARKLVAAGPGAFALASPHMSDDYKRESWKHMSEEERAVLIGLRRAVAAAEECSA